MMKKIKSLANKYIVTEYKIPSITHTVLNKIYVGADAC